MIFRKLLRALAIGSALLAPAALHGQTYQLYGGSPNPIPANSPGLTVSLSGYFPSAAPGYCFYTGYGSFSSIVANGGTFFNNYTQTINVPASTIQSIPLSMLTGGTFTATVYAVAAATSNCTATNPNTSYSSTITIPIKLPTLTSIDINTLPQHNPSANFSGIVSAPTELYVVGSNFASNAQATFTGSSTVTTAVTAVTATSARVDSPIIPSGTGVTLQICNPGPLYNACTSNLSLGILGLTTDTGTLTTSGSANNLTLTSTFGAAGGDTAGLPVGSTTFKDGTTTLGTANPSQVLPVFIPAATMGTWSSSGGGTLKGIQADFDKDGLPDVVVYDSATGFTNLHLLLGANNRGGFNNDAPVSLGFSLSCSTYVGMAVADFNNDGYADIAVACNNGSSSTSGYIYLLLNRGDATFTSTTLFVSQGMTAVAAADFNKDGNQDLVVVGKTAAGSNTFQVMFGTGTGSFSTTKSSTAGFAVGTLLLAADLNNDGYPDLALMDSAGGQITAWQNDKTGGFPTTPNFQRTGFAANALSNLLLTGPATYPSLTTVTPGVLTSVFNNQTSSVGFTTTGYVTNISGLVYATAADFTGDGNIDAAIYDGTSIAVYTTSASGFFSSNSLYSYPATIKEFAGAADFNSDGYPEALGLGYATNKGFVQTYVTSGRLVTNLTGQNLSLAGSHSLTATDPGTVAWAPGTASTTYNTPYTDTAVLGVSPASPVAYPQAETLTAYVTGNGASSPTGTVTFKDGANITLGTATLVSASSTQGQATLGVTLPPGTHTLSFTYPGSSPYPSNVSGSVTYTVNKGSQTINFPQPTTPATAGTAVTLSATGGASTSPVVFSVVSGPGTVSGTNGTTLTYTGAGTVVIAADQAADANYNAATQVRRSVVVNLATKTITFPQPTTPVTTGATATLTATASNGDPVTYSITGGTAGLSGNMITYTTAGTVTIAADSAATMTTAAASQVTQSVVVNPSVIATTTSVQAYPSPGTVGDDISFYANISGATSGPDMTGTVTFYDGTTVLGTSGVSFGFAYFDTASLTVGTHQITAVYSGDSNYTGSTSPEVDEVVQLVQTIVSWVQPADIVVGTPLTGKQLNATATDGSGQSEGLQPPGGNVPESGGSGGPQTNGNGGFQPNGVGNPVPGTFTYNPPAGTILSVGPHTLNVTFTPKDPSTYSGGTASVTINVTAAVTDPGTLTATPNPATTQNSVVLSATFGDLNSPAGVPSGTVTFKDNTTTVGTAPLKVVAEDFVAANLQPFGNYFTNPISASIADFNQDGIPDVLAVTGNQTISVLAGADHYGNLMPEAPVSFYGVGCYSMTGVVAADFNNDGYPDLAVLCSQGSNDILMVFLNYGDGTFNTNYPIVTNLSTVSTGFAAADFNNDGNMDVVLSGTTDSSGTNNALSVLLGDGTGNFPGLAQSVNAAAAGTQILAVDLNHDGYPDVVVGNPGAATSVFKNNGAGGFGPGPVYTTTFAGETQLFTAAPKGSVYPNLIAAASGTSGQIFVAQNNKTAALGFSATPTTTTVANLQSAAVGDFNGDGNPDVATWDGSNVTIYNGSATGTYSTPLSSFTGSPYGGQLAVTADVNGDGYADLLTLIPSGSDQQYAQASFLVTAGTASATLPGATYTQGTHPLSAALPATMTYAAGTATTSLVVNMPTPGVTLAVTPVSPTTYAPAGTETLKATVTTAQTPSATGTMKFFDGATLLGSGTLTQVTATTSTASVTVGPLVVGTHSLTAQYQGDTTYAAVSSTATSYVVNKGTPVITFVPNPATIVYGTALSAAQLNATATIGGVTVPGSFVYNPVLGSKLNAGPNQVLTATFTPTDTTDYNTPAAKTATVTVTKATPTVNWATPAPIAYGTALSATQLNATAVDPTSGATVPGTFTYNPPAGTLLPVGSNTLNVTFVPTDTTDYNNGTGSTTQVVTPTTFVAPTTPVGSTSAPQTAYVTITTAGTASAINVLTQGAANLDFKFVSGGTCSVSTAYTVGQVCSVMYSFAPTAPGARLGGITLTSGTTLLGTTYVSGTGTGPLGVILPGAISTVAGNGTTGYVASQDTGTTAATSAELFQPYSVAMDGTGNLFISDQGNQRIRKVSAATGFISTIAGNGTAGYVASQDTGTTPATSAEINYPAGIAIDGAGNLFIADSFNSRIRKVTSVTGFISTVAGNGTAGYVASQDTGNTPAISAELNMPSSVKVDGAGNLYIVDAGNQRIRKVSAATGFISTVAGNGTAGYVASQDTGTTPATSASLNGPVDVAIDTAGNLFISDYSNQRVRKVTAATGFISTVAGNGTQGYVAAEDTGTTAATSTELSQPLAVSVDAAGNLYIGDQLSRVRKVAASTGFISTVVGDGSQVYVASHDTGMTAATQSELYVPRGVLIDGAGNFYIADANHDRVRKVTATPAPLVFPATTVASSSGPQTDILSNNGNTTLTLTNLASSSTSYSLTGSTCTSTSTVAAGNGCTLAVTFTPLALNTINGNINATDNTLNVPGTVQTLAVTGTGAAATKTITFPQPTSPATFGTSATLTATASNGDPVTYSIVSGTASLSGSTITYTAVGNVTIAADSAANGVYAAATQVQRTVTVTQAAQAISFTQPASPVTIGSTATLSATGGASGNPVVFSIQSGPATVSGTNGSTITYTGAGTVVIAADQAGNTNYSAAPTVMRSVAVNQTAQAINFTQPTTPATFGTSVTLSATGGASGNPVVFSVQSGPATVSGTNGSTLTYTGVGTVVVAANQAGNTNFSAAPTATRSVTVNQATQTISFTQPTTPVAIGATATLSATGGASGNPVVFSVQSGPATVSGTNGSTITYTGAGTVVIAADQAGNTNYSAATTVTRSVTVNQTAQAITFTQPATPATFGTSVTLPATGGASGNPVVFSVQSGPATVSGTNGSTLTYTGVGTVVVAADQAGNTNYSAAPTVTRNVTVNQATQTISFTQPVTPVAIGGTATLSATGGASGNPVVFSVQSGPATVSGTNGSTITYTGAGTVVIAANQAGNTNYSAATTATRSVTVNQTAQAISFTQPATPATFGTSVTLSATGGASGNPVMFSVQSGPATVSGTNGSTLTYTGVGTVVVAADQAGNTNYSAAPTVTRSVTVNQATQTISFPQPATPVAIGGTATLSATGGASGNPVVFSIQSGPATVSGTNGTTITYTGAGTVVIAADQAGNTNYAAATTATRSVTVSQTAQAISFTQPATPATFGTSVTLSATGGASGNPVVFSVQSGPATVSGTNGSTLTYTGVGTVVVAADQAGNTNYSAAPTVTRTVTVSQASQTITFPQPPTPVAIGSTATLSATGGASGNPVVFSIQSGPATVSGTNGTTITYTGAGTVVIAANQAGNTNYTAAPAVTDSVVVSPASSSYNAGTVAVGNSSGTLSATVNITTSIAGAVPTVSVVTQGLAGLDFNVVPGGTCAGMTAFTAGQTCTVLYAFTPTRAGSRYGGISLKAGGTMLGASFLSGTGTGPQVAFSLSTPAVPLTLGGGFKGDQGVAVDAASNVYVADSSNGAVKKIPVGCTAASCVTTLGGGISNPDSIAIDGNGNVFVFDFFTSSVKEIPAGCTSASCVTTVGGGFSSSFGIATDGSGNVYVAETNGSDVKQIVPGCGTASCVVTVGGGFNRPQGVAVDGSGTLYVADTGNGALKKVPAGCSSASCVTSAPQSNPPLSVAVDGVGNVYFTDTNTFQINKVPVGCSSTSCVTALGSGFTSPFGVAVDGNGNIYVADSGNSAVKEIDFADAPSLTFGSTTVGSNSAQQVVTVTNIGNVTALAISALSGTNANFGGAATSCTTSTSLAPAASCNLGVQFAPTATGNPLTGSANITDNNLNVAGSVQSIGVSGVATPIAKSINFTTLTSPAALGSTATLSATASNGDPVTFSVIAGTASISGNTLTYTNAGTVTIAANSPAMGNYSAAPQVMQTVTVNQGLPTISWTMPAAISYGTALSATQLNATAAYGGNAVPGTFTYNPAAGTVLGAGTQTLNVTFVPTDTVNYKSATGSTTIVVNKSTPTIRWSTPVPVTYGTALSATQLNASAINPVNGAAVPGTFTYNPAAGTVLGVGAQTLNVTFVPTDTTDLNNASGSTSIVVNKATPTITWSTPAAIPYGTALSSTQLNATATNPVSGVAVPGTFTYNPAAGTVLNAGTQTLNVSFVPTDAVDYVNGAGSTTLLVNKATPTITWTTPAAVPYGTALSATQLNATAVSPVTGATVPGTFTYSPAAGTVLNAGTQTLGVTFVPTDAADFTNGTGSTTIVVNKATPAITWATPASIAYGTALSGTQLNASATNPVTGAVVPGTFVYNPAAGTVLPAGTNPLAVTFTPTDLANYVVATGSNSIVVTQGALTINWPKPAPITFGTALSNTQLNATVTNSQGTTIPGTFTYNPPAGTILGAGTQLLGVRFVPTDQVNYTAQTATQTIVVNPATPVIAFPSVGAVTDIVVPYTPTGNTLYQSNWTEALQGDQIAAAPKTGSTGTGVTFGNYAGRFNATAAGSTGGFSFTPVPLNGNAVVHTLFNTFKGSPNPDAVVTFTNSVGQTATFTLVGNQTIRDYFDNTTLNFANGLQGNNSDPTLGGVTATTWWTNFAGNSGYVRLDMQTFTLPAAWAGTNLVSVQIANPANSNSDAVLSAMQVMNGGSSTLAPITYGTALGSTQLNAVATNPITGGNVPGTFTYNPPAGTVLPAGTQNLGVTFVPTDAIDYTNAAAATSLLVNKTTPTITWATPAAIVAGTPLSATQLNATATNPVSGATVAGVFTYTPAAGTVLPVGSNTLNVSFVPTDLADYVGATGSVTQLVNPGTTMAPLSSTLNPSTFGQAVTLVSMVVSTGTAPITGTVSFFDGTTLLGTVNVLAGKAGLTLSTLTAGTHIISASYSGDANNGPATTSGFSQVVNKATPSVAWATPATIVYGTPLSAAQLNATATGVTGSALAGTFNYNPAAGTVLQAGTRTLSVTFVPTDTLDYINAIGATSVVVTQATPVVNWTIPAPITAGTPLSATQLNATATGIGGVALPGVFTYTPAAGTVLPTGNNTLNVSFVPTDALDYKSATGTVTQVVNAAVTTATVTSSQNPSTYGQAVTLTATLSSVYTGAVPTGTVNFFDGTTALGSGTIAAGVVSITTSALTAGTHSITAVFGGDANFASATSAALSQVVNRAAPVISWNTPASIVYGTPLSAAQLNATAAAGGVSVPGTFVYNPVAGTVLGAGTRTLNVSFTPTDAANFSAATGQVTLLVTQATPTITWAAPASISAGTPLSATQLNATAAGVGGVALPGTFTYTPAAGAVLPVGATTLKVSFVPTDAVDYAVATASVPLTVTTAVTTAVLTSSANPSAYGAPVTLTATLSSVFTASPITGTVGFFDGTTSLGTGTVSGGVATLATSTLAAGSHSITAVYSGDSNFGKVTSAALTQVVTSATTVISWATPAAIAYGTPLSATQLNATVTAPNAATVPGTFVYTPAAGTVLAAGTQTLSVVFTPTDTLNFKTATATVSLLVTQVTPTITWATPADVVAGTTLSATQLNATATGVGGSALPGVFVYTPASGTVLTAGVKTLSVTFTPTDLVNYTTATRTVSLNVIGVSLTSLSTTAALLGDPAKTITLSGTGFVSNSVVMADGAAVATTFVNGTTLTAVIPAADFTTVHSIPVFVSDPTQGQTTNTLNLSVTAAPLNATVSAPTTVIPGAQPTVSVAVTNTYPVPVTATFTLTFTPATGLPNDPTVLFSNGTRTVTVTVPAGSSTPILLPFQSGSVAGTITIASAFTAGGVTITPTGGAQTVTIASPAAVPGITSTTLTRSGNSLTVVTLIYSNTRAVDHVTFHFVPAAGQKIGTPDVTVDGSLFTAYYASQASLPYGSAALYTQTFTLDEDASVVGEVDVTVVNAIGNSQAGSAK